MSFLNWMKGGQGRESQPVRKYGRDEVAFRFQKPFAHLEYYMSSEDKKVVAEIEVRWKGRYETFKNHPPISEGQDHGMRVFRALDGLMKALPERERAPYAEWEQRKAEVDKAIIRARVAFGNQRRFVGHEIGEMDEHHKKLAPDHRRKRRGNWHDR